LRIRYIGPARSGPGQVAVARVLKPHGVRGEVKIAWLAPEASGFLKKGDDFFLVDQEHKPLGEFSVKRLKPGGETAVLEVHSIGGRDQVETWRNAEVQRTGDDLPRHQGERYWHEVAGFAAETQEARRIGRLVDYMVTAAHGVLVIQGDFGREYLVPAVDQCVLRVEEESNKIILAPPPGLLEIYE